LEKIYLPVPRRQKTIFGIPSNAFGQRFSGTIFAGIFGLRTLFFEGLELRYAGP